MGLGSAAIALMRASLVLGILLSTAVTSSAIDTAYLGTWSRSADKCEFDDVFRITRQGMSGHEFACKTTRSSRSENGWSLRLACSEEGNTYTLDVRWQLLENGRLRQTSKGKVTEYARCAGSATPRSQPALMDTPFGRVTQQEFARKCVGCFNEAQGMGRSVGGYCPVGCVDVFSTMVCDNRGQCRAGP